MTITLMDHQLEDASFLSSAPGVAGCFNGMGSGKTLTALEAYNLVRDGAGDLRLLIVGPPISLRMWQREVLRHCGVEVTILKTGKTPIPTDGTACACSYEIATKRAQELGSWLEGGVLICDESHALKSWEGGTKRTHAILGDGGLAFMASYAWMLTGTPQTRWNDDLFPFLRAALPETLKAKTGGLSLDRFRRRYCVMQRRQYPGQRFAKWVTVGNANTGELAQLVASVATRRTLEDVWADMPPLSINRLQVEPHLSTDLKRDLAALSGKSEEEIIRSIRNPDEDGYLSTLMRNLGLAMVKEAADYIWQRVDAGAGPVLVGCWHLDVVDLLLSELRKKRICVEALDGRTTPKERDRLEAAFNAKRVDVLIGQIKAMGVSLNLQAGGNAIVTLEESWSPDDMDQFYARLHRMGQEKPVTVDALYMDTKLHKAQRGVNGSKRSAHHLFSDEHKKALKEMNDGL